MPNQVKIHKADISNYPVCMIVLTSKRYQVTSNDAEVTCTKCRKQIEQTTAAVSELIQAKLSRIHLHLRATQNSASYYGHIYSEFKPLPFRAYSDALTILESISQANGGKLGLE